MQVLFRGLARALLWLEPLLLGLIVLAFWYPTPTRTDWLWTLLLLVPVYLARLYIHHRLVTRTLLDLFFWLSSSWASSTSMRLPIHAV